MEKHVLSLVLLAVMPTLASAQDWKDALKARLEEAIVLTKTSWDRLRITSPGTVLIAQREGISGGLASDASILVNKVKNGEVHQAKGLLVDLADKKTNRDYTVGERLYCYEIRVKDTEVGLFLITAQTAPVTVKGTTQQTRYKSALYFEFPKGALESTDANTVLAEIGKVIAPEKSTASEPATVSLGQTPAEVESLLGKPKRILDLGAKRVYVYEDLKVTFVEGKVADVE